MNILLMMCIPAIGCLLGSGFMGFIYITMSDNPVYLLLTAALLVISFICIAMVAFLATMISPVMPYLDAVLFKKPLMIINRTDDNLIFIAGDNRATTIDIKNFGTFVTNPNAVRTFIGSNIEIENGTKTRSLGGIKTFLVYEESAIPQELDLTKLAKRLDAAGFKSLADWKTSLKNNENPIMVKDLDLKVLARYFEYVNPHYLNVRIERIAAELAAEYRRSWEKIIPWVSIMMVFMIIAAIAFVIIQSVTTGDNSGSTAPVIISGGP